MNGLLNECYWPILHGNGLNVRRIEMAYILLIL